MNSIQTYKQNSYIYGTDIYGKHISGVSHSVGDYTEKIIEDFFEIYSSIKDLKDEEILQDPSNYLKTIFQKLDYLISLNVSGKSAEVILCDSVFNLAFNAIARFRSLYTAKLEIDYAYSILESK